MAKEFALPFREIRGEGRARTESWARIHEAVEKLLKAHNLTEVGKMM